MMTLINIDLNVRIRGNDTYAGFEDVVGPLILGQDVIVHEPECSLFGHGRITEIDPVRSIVYLSVEWESLSPEPFNTIAPVVWTRYESDVVAAGQVFLAMSTSSEIWVSSRTLPFGVECGPSQSSEAPREEAAAIPPDPRSHMVMVR